MAAIATTICTNPPDLGAEEVGLASSNVGAGGLDANEPIFMFTRERYSSSNGKTNDRAYKASDTNVLQ
jgi:hypothetical protein